MHRAAGPLRAASLGTSAPIVFLVDDDLSVRESLQALVRFAGWQACAFKSAEDFLAGLPTDSPGCIVLDLSMPGLDGLQLQEQLASAGNCLPIIFLTGNADVPRTVRAMKAGAQEFLTKPCDDHVLLAAIERSIALSRTALENQTRMDELRGRYSSLSPREREVLALVVTGRLNKQVAGDLGISEITVKVHRGNVMRKMEAASLPDLVTMWARLGARDSTA